MARWIMKVGPSRAANVRAPDGVVTEMIVGDAGLPSKAVGAVGGDGEPVDIAVVLVEGIAHWDVEVILEDARVGANDITLARVVEAFPEDVRGKQGGSVRAWS